MPRDLRKHPLRTKRPNLSIALGAGLLGLLQIDTGDGALAALSNAAAACLLLAAAMFLHIAWRETRD